MGNNLSTKISTSILAELEHALSLISGYGSIELYIQDGVITQITARNIKKTKIEVSKESKAKSR